MIDGHRVVDSETIECVIDRLCGVDWINGDPIDRIRSLFPEFYKTLDELRAPRSMASSPNEYPDW